MKKKYIFPKIEQLAIEPTNIAVVSIVREEEVMIVDPNDVR